MWDLLKGLVWSLLYWALVCAVAVLVGPEESNADVSDKSPE